MADAPAPTNEKPPEIAPMDALGRPLPQEAPSQSKAYDSNDPVAVNNAKKAAANLRNLDNNVVRTIMESKEGRDWLYRKLEGAWIFGNAFYPGQSDVTAFRLGEQNQGKMLLVEAQRAAPELYLRMLREQNEKRKGKEEPAQ